MSSFDDADAPLTSATPTSGRHGTRAAALGARVQSQAAVVADLDRRVAQIDSAIAEMIRRGTNALAAIDIIRGTAVGYCSRPGPGTSMRTKCPHATVYPTSSSFVAVGCSNCVGETPTIALKSRIICA